MIHGLATNLPTGGQVHECYYLKPEVGVQKFLFPNLLFQITFYKIIRAFEA
jgi:hypothetical protein